MRSLLVSALALAACRGHADDRSDRNASPAGSGPPSPNLIDASNPPLDARPPDAGPVAGVMPVEGDVTLRDFQFKSGERLAELRIHYTTLGTLAKDASGHATNAVLVMHGTTGSGHQFLVPQFADELYGPGQPLDLRQYYVILPDDIGHGASSKPSDGLRAKFPHYDYDDMVAAEHAVVEQLGVDHLRLVMGTSMGCMHAWMWAEKWPDVMDAVMPLACLPVPIAGRNREWRKMIIDAISHDPEYRGGDYATEPRAGLETAADLMMIAGSAPLAQQAKEGTRELADKSVLDRTRAFLATHDANDVLYALGSSWDYDPSKDLEAITAPVMFVNSADDFINPPELGIAEREIKRVKHGRFVLIPASADTHGHGTHTWAKLWKQYLVDLLQQSHR
jgi:homoserine O-acetyltransferase